MDVYGEDTGESNRAHGIDSTTMGNKILSSSIKEGSGRVNATQPRQSRKPMDTIGIQSKPPPGGEMVGGGWRITVSLSSIILVAEWLRQLFDQLGQDETYKAPDKLPHIICYIIRN